MKRRRLFHAASRRSWWGEIGVIAGGAAVAVTLFAGLPYGGAWSLGWWRIAGIAIGLGAFGAGLLAVLQDSILRANIKAAVVAITVTAVGAFALFGVEHVPANLPSCGAVELTLENRGPVYCERGDGTLIRMSTSVTGCPDGRLGYRITTAERWGRGWIYRGPSTMPTCPL